MVSVIFCGSKIFCANAGDSRAVMARQLNGRYQTINLSIDHKPTLASERDRIIKAGGRVDCQKGMQRWLPLDIYGHQIGPMRVWLQKVDMPGLAMTRSFGDKVGA